MSNITKFEPNTGLTQMEASIVIASKGTRIFHMEEKELKNLILTTMTMALFDLGQSMATSDRQVLETRIKEDLIKYFGKYTDHEFRKAVELGVRGEFKTKPEDVIFISVKGINEWLKKYGNGLKIEAMKKQRILDDKKEKEMEVEKQEEKKKLSELIEVQDLIASFATFKDTGAIYDPLNVLYDHLDKKGLVKLSNERKKIIYDHAFEEYKARYKGGNSISEYTVNKKVLAEIEQGSSRIQALVKVLAKQKALKVIFQDIIELGLTMEEYLNEGI